MKVSACVIVKDEEKHLPTWLASMRRLADEMIVVDTGSHDKTVEIAEAAGAAVCHFAWINDFAAAKNYAIDQASGDWIIFCDADEYFPEEEAGLVLSHIRHYDLQKDVLGIFCPIINIDLDHDGMVLDEDRQIRIFRKMLDLRFVRPVHECLSYTGPRQMTAKLVTDIHIYHTGYSAKLMHKKSVRNYELLKAREEAGGWQDSDNNYMIDACYALCRYEETLAYVHRALVREKECHGMELRQYGIWMDAAVHLGLADEVREAWDAGRKAFPGAPIFSFIAARWEQQRGNLEAEEKLLRQALAEHEAVAVQAEDSKERLDKGIFMQLPKLRQRLTELRQEREGEKGKGRKKQTVLRLTVAEQQKLAACREKVYDLFQAKDFAVGRKEAETLMAIAPTEAMGMVTASYIEEGKAADARKALVRLQEAAPDDIYTHYLDAGILRLEKRYVSAYKELAALRDEPMAPSLRLRISNLIGHLARAMGDPAAGIEASHAAIEAAKAEGDPAAAAREYSNVLFMRHSLPPAPPTEERVIAAVYDDFFKDVSRFLHRRREADGGKIRIGYLSSDLRRHVVLCFSAAMLMAYDRAHFEVYVYHTGADDAYSQGMMGKVTVWRNLYGRSQEEVARTIYEDGVDILVDLAGHTSGNNLPAMAEKPAPVIVSGIGFFASTGLSAVDYFLGDAIMDGAAGSSVAAAIDASFTEKLIRLPHSHFCYMPFAGEPVAEELPARKNGYITFGSFNDFGKVTDHVLSVWKKVLDAVPGSRLFLKAGVLDNEEGREYALGRIEAAGIPRERIDMEGLTREYLGRYRAVDIALDTFPYPGGGTTCDALHMGVPVVALVTASHGGRFPLSLLTNIGLPELCTFTEEEYVARAVSLAGDLDTLEALHRGLRPMMEKSPLMDPPGYMREVEAAYRAIWDTYIRSQKAPSYDEMRQLRKVFAAFDEAGDRKQKLAAADAILAGNPKDDDLRQMLAVAYLDAGEGKNAEKALEGLPGTPECRYYRAQSLFQQGKTGEARQMAEAVLADGSELERWLLGALHNLLASLAKAEGDRRRAAEEYLASSRCKTLATGAAAEYSNYLLMQHYYEEDEDKLFAAAEGYAGVLSSIRPMKPRKLGKSHHDKLRIGYISPDFCRHIVAAFSLAFFRHRDGSRFTTYAYSTAEPDGVTAEIARSADVFRDLRGLSCEAQAERIRADEVDILFDLSGHTGDDALPVLAYRPAPVQISGIGYFATTGLPAVDYFLADQVTAPAGEERYFTEKLLRLPCSHFCYTPLFTRPVQEVLPSERKGYVTFGTLNQYDKVTDDMLLLWKEILTSVPGSHLLLKGGALSGAARLEREKARLARLGLPLDRITFEGWTADYLAAYDEIDVALDTYPYTGGGTTCDALYMGVPVVSRYGTSHHTRFGLGILSAVGVEAYCAAKDREEYREKAVKLTQDTGLRRLFRMGLRRRMEDTILDGRRYMAELEAVYEDLWQQASGGKEATAREELLRAFDVQTAGRYAEVFVHARRAREKGENLLETGCLMVHALYEKGRWQEALALAETTLSEEGGREDLPGAREKLLAERASLAYTVGDARAPELYHEAFEAARSLSQGAPSAEALSLYSSYLLSQNAREVDEAALFQEHLAYGKMLAGVRPFTEFHHRAGRKLRIGYISADFRQHVMAHFILPFFSERDAEQFELYAYSLGREQDAVMEEFARLSDTFRDVSKPSIEEAARQIHDDGIDILVDFAGHSEGGGTLPVLAYKPAPVIFSGLSYMATTGLRAVDYFLTDRAADPEGLHEQFFTEKLAPLTSQFLYAPTGGLPASTGAPCRKTGHITFGVFNHWRKYSIDMMEAWGEILRQVPGAQLLLKCQAFRDFRVLERARTQLADAGIDPARVRFAPATRKYMTDYLAVDIALDTYPYPGGGTTCDALYMGVPVVSRYGERRSSRFGLSVLTAAGLIELAVPDRESYVRRAVALARDIDTLDLMHRNLRKILVNSPLMDVRGYMREVEKAYKEAFEGMKRAGVE